MVSRVPNLVWCRPSSRCYRRVSRETERHLADTGKDRWCRRRTQRTKTTSAMEIPHWSLLTPRQADSANLQHSVRSDIGAYRRTPLKRDGRLKTRDLTSRDLTTRHQIAGVDIARLVSVFEYLLTNKFFCYYECYTNCRYQFVLIVYHLSVLCLTKHV